MSGMREELRIDLDALRRNYLYLDSLSAAGCETACAVKADAYGLGMREVAPALASAGAKSFFVAHIDEAVTLRAILGEAEIYVLNGFDFRAAYDYVAHRIIPILNSLDDIAAAREKLPAGHHCALHCDTGMNRLGLSGGELEQIYNDRSLLGDLNIVLVMSHFTSSEDKNHPSIARQQQRFIDIKKQFQGVRFSFCNSGGIFNAPDAHYDLVRPGVALYGGNPVLEGGMQIAPVVELRAPVLQVRDALINETAGYNETYCFSVKSKLAVVGAGYADGIFRSLSNRGVFYWKGYALPIRGRVSMDLVICDLCNVPPEEYPDPYDMVEIIGPHQSVDDLARAAGTISYEILTSLGARYRRLYID